MKKQKKRHHILRSGNEGEKNQTFYHRGTISKYIGTHEQDSLSILKLLKNRKCFNSIMQSKYVETIYTKVHSGSDLKLKFSIKVKSKK